MSKEREDNRDVFEKATELLAPAVGTVIGGAIARRIGNLSRSARKALEKKKMEETLRLHRHAKSRRTIYGASVGGATGAYYNYAEGGEKKKRRN